MDETVQRARRVADLADAALHQAEATRRAVELVLAAVDGVPESDPGPIGAAAGQHSAPPQPAPSGHAEVVPLDASVDAARLAAIELAVAGRSRAEVGSHLRAAYAVEDLDALLDDVFGPRAERQAL
jgi:hypothetical protein